jgi:hypothetical protein
MVGVSSEVAISVGVAEGRRVTVRVGNDVFEGSSVNVSETSRMVAIGDAVVWLHPVLKQRAINHMIESLAWFIEQIYSFLCYHCGRTASYPTGPAQIPTRGTTTPGRHSGWWRN